SIGQPEVFTRQRLVNRRLTERSWLEGQLATNTPTTQLIQGYRDVRVFSGTYSKTGVTFDPLGGALSSARGQQSLQNVQNQSELAALKHQIAVAKLQQQLAAQRSTAASSNAGAGGTSASSPPSTSGASTGASPPPSPGAQTPTPSTVFSSPPP